MDGERKHKAGPHIHAVLGATDWRLLLRNDDYEVKNGDFSLQDKRKMWRGYHENKADFVARWDEKYSDDPVEAPTQKPTKDRKRQRDGN